MRITSLSKLLLTAVAAVALLTGCGGGGTQGGSSPQNLFPAANFPGPSQFSNQGLPNGNPTLAQLLRGRYLVTSGGCTECHSAQGDDPTNPLYLAGAVVDPVENPDHAGFFPPGGNFFGGGANFGQFTSFASNLTMDSTGINFHSPLELFLGFRTGVHHHNSGLMCEPMPWKFFTHMTDDDTWSCVAYLRSLRPVHNVVAFAAGADGITPLGLTNCNSFPETVENIPNYPGANEIAVTNTSGPGIPNGPATLQQVLEGRYLVTAVLACASCHGHNSDDPNDPNYMSGFTADTTINPSGFGKFVAGNGFTTFATNLTPDKTGIGNFSVDQLFGVLRTGTITFGKNTITLTPPMPWPDYRNLTDGDIFAVIAYLQSLKPVANKPPFPSGTPVPFTTLGPFPLPPYPAVQEINPQFAQ